MKTVYSVKTTHSMKTTHFFKTANSSPFIGRGGKGLWIALLALLLTATPVLGKDLRTVVFKVEQMECENCVKKISNNIRFEKGLKSYQNDLKTKTVTITYDAEKTNIEKLKEGFRKFHYEAQVVKKAP